MEKTSTPSSHLSRQRGSAIIEFIATALPVLLLGLGATETARWFIHKQHIRFALLETQRVASVTHAQPERIITAFETALNPLFAPAGLYKSVEARRDAYLTSISQTSGMAPWRISIISPTAEHFKDFKQDDLDIALRTGFASINNNYQQEQHQEKGLGLYSQESIYEANILSVNLVYPYKPLVPGVNHLMKLLSKSTQSRLKQSYYDSGYLPLELTAHLGMQSHPVQWPNDPTSKVIWQDNTNTIDNVIINSDDTLLSNDPCAGLWCPDNNNQYASLNNNPQFKLPNDSSSIYNDYQPPQNANNGAISDLDNDTTNSWLPDDISNNILDDPLCGSSLCCA